MKIQQEVQCTVRTILYDTMKKKLPAIASRMTEHYLVVADNSSLDEGEDDMPRKYSAYPIDDSSLPYLQIWFSDDNNHVIVAQGVNDRIDWYMLNEILDEVGKIAAEFTIENCAEAKMEIVSPGYQDVLWLSNGDPGYQGELTEYRGLCPHCGCVIRKTEGTHRCEQCKKYYQIVYEDMVY